MKNFLAGEWRKDHALKRGGAVEILSLDFDSAEESYRLEPSHELSPEAIYERRWALGMIERAVTDLQRQYAKAGNLGEYRAADPNRPAMTPSRPEEPRPRPEQRHDYEYRSARTVFGLPLVHIAHASDPTGKRLRVASGVIAIGDVTIGVVAIGAFSFGGITIGGFAIGLVSFGGAVLGLLTAIGGFAVGGFAVGGFSAALVAAHGALHFAQLTLTEAALARATLVGWLIATVGLTIGAVATGYAWVSAAGAQPTRRG